ncbi:GatB/YqeY domain-containing protein [Nocardioides jejuensis]|uniref:GatB/YqeY domain-containing protein n=1 Tax=Nocardioides jejuensis TaxID=2502782 RepID=A0A4R1CFI9_9ACTN|nr:GatB/YqeY domain-containing protein [Nocardioides jejuensis]TCJ29869.1 GatB/YqeY domain-containing protein [Nocardioides jejuensis]
MSALKDQLRADLTTAMKARDKETSGTLRMIMTSIGAAEVAGKDRVELSDEQVLAVLTTEAKKRREAAAAFNEGGRTEMAEKERAELAVIVTYLPEQLTAEQISDIVAKAIEQTGAAAEGPRAMGKVMGIVQPQVKGRADGGAVAAEVKKQLG